MKKKILLLFLAIMSAAALVPCGVTYAANTCTNVSPLPGIRSWYAGLNCDGNGAPILEQAGSEDDAASKINSIVWTIAGNIIATIAAIIGYVSIGFIIWGGFTYIISRGDPGNLAKGKKTVVRAVIGLAICILANSIISIIIDVLSGAAK
jgi:hypothetical protein